MNGLKRIMVVDDEAPFRKLLQRRLSQNGSSVEGFESSESAITAAEQKDFDVALVDIKMPGMDGIELLQRLKKIHSNMEVIIITGQGTIDSAIAAMKLGAYDYLTKPCKLSELDLIVQKAYEKSNLQKQNLLLKDQLRHRNPYDTIIGRSKNIREVIHLTNKVAPTSSPVLIEGESGTGKELVANTIHKKSKRSEGPFIVVNCAALQENLLENELFGHEKGAFTGASALKHGLFEMADRGTFFIDEISEMNPNIQAKLLRVIELGEFRRVGGNRQIRVDVRIIAATNRNLEEEVKRGRFREDLFYRLNVVTISLPSLRERKEDIPLLVDYFLKNKEIDGGWGKTISPEAIECLKNYHWPGNIRELANVLERGLILSTGNTLSIKDFPLSILAQNVKIQKSTSTLVSLERDLIERTLRELKGNKTRTAKALGISLRNLYRKIEKYQIEV
ncbi:MAG: sigma-54 dependent transcriptional regulator [Thermodesulfobacteriota bacterium]|nr:sigma-54 dependent transcriptional regulator [Thermodesulfobacteriota bacterium]